MQLIQLQTNAGGIQRNEPDLGYNTASRAIALGYVSAVHLAVVKVAENHDPKRQSHSRPF